MKVALARAHTIYLRITHFDFFTQLNRRGQLQTFARSGRCVVLNTGHHASKRQQKKTFGANCKRNVRNEDTI